MPCQVIDIFWYNRYIWEFEKYVQMEQRCFMTDDWLINEYYKKYLVSWIYLNTVEMKLFEILLVMCYFIFWSIFRIFRISIESIFSMIV